MIAALPLAWKIGAPIGLAVSIIGGYLAWQYHQQSIGREQERAEHYAQILEQQQEALGHYIVSESRKLRTVERAGSEKDRVNAQLRQNFQAILELDRSQEEREKNGVMYEPCVVSPRVRGGVNDLGRLFNSVSTDSAAASSGAAGEPLGSRGGSAGRDARGGDGDGSPQTDPRADGAAEPPHH